MLQWFRRVLTAPVFEGDVDKTNMANHVHAMTWLTLATMLTYAIALPIFAPQLAGRVIFLAPLFALQIAVLAWVRRGRIRWGATASLVGFWIAFGMAAFINGGVRSAPYNGHIVLILNAAILFGWRTALGFAGMSLAQGLVLVWAEGNGMLPPLATTPIAVLLLQAAFFITGAGSLHFAMLRIRQALERASRELSERQRAEETLRENKARQDALLSAIPELVFRIRRDGVFLDYHALTAEQLLTPLNLFLGKPVQTVMPPDVADMAMQAVRQVLQTGQAAQFEYSLTAQDQARYFDARMVVSGPDEVLTTVRDITERKTIEQALTRRATELQALYEASLDLGAQPDLTTLFQTVVNHASRLLSVQAGSLYLLQPDQTLELRVLNNLPDKYLGVRLRLGEGLAGRVMQAGRPMTVEDYQNWDGRATIFEDIPSRRVLSVPLRTRLRIIGVLNVTDIYRAGPFSQDEIRLLSLFADQAAAAIENAQLYEQAQQRAEQLATMNEIGHAVSTLQDLDSVLEIIYRQVQRIVLVDAFYVGLYDPERDQVTFPLMYDMGNRYSEPALPLAQAPWMAHVVHTGRPFMLHRTAEDLQTPLLGGIGSVQRKSASVLIVPLWQGERVTGVLSAQSYTLNAYTDEHAEILTGIGHQAAIAIENAQLYEQARQEIVERKRVQAERERLIADLEAKNAELERFAYTVSHDLRAPLVTIRGFLGFLEKDAVSGNLGRLKADMRRITEATDKMQRLLAELLELSRIGRMMNPPQETPFEQIAREAVQLVHGRLAARGVRVEIAEGLPTITGDRARLVEVMQNLVDNAAKFMGEQPDPRIEIGVRGVDAEGKPILFVRDNGVGIEPQYHERVFGLFNKLDAQSEGTGVGLALVKRIVEVHGGRIWVESAVAGQGTTFCFTLRMSPAV